MKQLKSKILENKKISEGFYKMRVESSYLAKYAKPGQFIEVRCSNGADPLLRRPLGVHRITETGIEMLYEVVGIGTEILSRIKAGGLLDVIGPLGNGFSLHPTPYTLNPILVAGGIGVAPLLALAEKLVHGPRSTAHGKKLYVLIGACKKEHVLCEKEFKKLGAEVFVATEDGSKGYKGLITDVLKDFLMPHTPQPTTIYACGPTGMLEAVAGIAKKHKIPCQVSLEEHMACGVGVCLGCPVRVHAQYPILNTQYSYKMVCKDGPVFNAMEIEW